jgi:hypothetical protein
MMDDSTRAVKEIRCIECDSLVGWWHIGTKKIFPLKREWCQKERLEMG